MRTPRPCVGEGRRACPAEACGRRRKRKPFDVAEGREPVERRTRGEGGGGFTLIEVIVALAICSCALVMLASVGNESLRRSLRARNSAMLDQACQSKLTECACGMEGSREGEFAGMPGWRWKVEIEPVSVEEVEGIERVKLSARATEGQGREKLLSVLRYRAGTKP